MTVQYISLEYEEYKGLEEQMRAFTETTHTSTGGFYHKSIRLRINSDLIMEFHGPLVHAAEQTTPLSDIDAALEARLKDGDYLTTDERLALAGRGDAKPIHKDYGMGMGNSDPYESDDGE